MGIKKEIANEKNIIKDIINRIKKRDFTGYTGIALKNLIYQTVGNFVGKIGGLIFTIILARLLMPELFGLYNLALSTIFLFATFSGLGIGETFITFVSKELGKNRKEKAKAYALYLLKIKLILFIVSSFALLLSAKFISETYYKKPIFLALIAGLLYITFFELGNFLGFVFQSSNNFKIVSMKEIIFQISRLILVPIAIILSLKYSLSTEKILFYIILMLALSFMISSILVIFKIREKDLINERKEKLTTNQKKQTKNFLLITSILIFSGTFFSLIDKIMLGRFVNAEFIGYYSASVGLIAALCSLIGFSSVLLPIFSRLVNKKIVKGLNKSLKIFFILGLFTFLITIIFAPLGIWIAYGKEYTTSVNILRLMSPLLIILPVISLYSVYFLSRREPMVIAKLLIISTIINIILNYILITSFMKYGDLEAIYGAGTATIISQLVFLLGLVYYKNR